MFAALVPVAFVLIWSTGWVVAKTAAPHADPLAFLALRYVLAIAILAPLAFALRAAWPSTWRGWTDAMLNGVLLHGLYLGGVWWAIAHGVPAGISALIAALQPLFTALVAGPLVGERLGPRRWIGVALGVAGVALVIAPKLADAAGALEGLWFPITVNVVAMAAVTAATLHQKRALAGVSLLTLASAQYIGALLVTVPAVFAFGQWRIEAAPGLWGALAWSVIVLSIGGVMLMLVMIERGEVSRVAALIYLVPPIAAVQAYGLFGETLSALQMIGMTLAAVGVLLANGSGRPGSAEGCIAVDGAVDEDESKTPRRPA